MAKVSYTLQHVLLRSMCNGIASNYKTARQDRPRRRRERDKLRRQIETSEEQEEAHMVI